jgi:hypothetical protein
MKLFGREVTGFAKATVMFVAVLLVAIGLCAINGEIEQQRGWSYFGGPGFPNTAFADLIVALDWLGAGAIVVSAAGLAFVTVGWPVSSLYRSVTHPNRNRLQKLLDDSKRDEGDGGGTQ